VLKKTDVRPVRSSFAERDGNSPRFRLFFLSPPGRFTHVFLIDPTLVMINHPFSLSLMLLGFSVCRAGRGLRVDPGASFLVAIVYDSDVSFWSG